MKFKKGDVVIVERGVGDKNVKNAVGKILDVSGYDYSIEFVQFIKGHDCGGRGKKGYCWFVNDGYGVKLSKSPVILIRQKDNETIAELKQGKTIIKSAKATCNSSDTYDFNTGAKLAFSRLMGEEVKAEVKPFDWQGFKSGKFAVHCDTEEKAKSFLRECDGHGIAWCSGKKPSDGFEWTPNFSCYHIDNNLYRDRIEYCMDDLKLSVINYLSSVREVHRPAKVGEWIRVTESDSVHNKYKAGEIYKTLEVAKDGCPRVLPRRCRDDNDCYNFVTGKDSYVVLENYQPPKEEQRPFKVAKVGDKIKIVHKSEDWHVPQVKIGDVQTVLEFRPGGVFTDKRNVFYDKYEEYIIIEEVPEKPDPIKPHLEVATMDELLAEIKHRTEGLK